VHLNLGAFKLGHKNYHFCYGTTFVGTWNQQSDGAFSGTWNRSGFQDLYYDFAAIRDGTSNTIAMGERTHRPSNRRVLGNVAWNVAMPSPSTGYPAVCLAQVTGRDYNAGVSLSTWSSGELWAFGHPHWNAFVTVLPPNSPSCSPHTGDNLSNASGLFTATSLHPGGVQVVMVDGSVRFVPNTINSTGGPTLWGVWGAMGTRDGGESGN
jgi:prepilin-type processing-associated H-X9-DG protein